MIDYIVGSASLKTLSPYWLFLARRNIKQLVMGGIYNFKQTIARDYFVIVSWKRREYYENLFKNIKPNDLVALPNILKEHEYFSHDTAVSYNIFTSLLLNYVRSLPSANRYLLLEEPMVGCPAVILNDDKFVSSDLLNSIIDFNSIFSEISEENIHCVLEVGAGYGRNAFCNISLLPELKQYIVVDIPPALYLSQTYLSEVFPDKKVFKFRSFGAFEEIEKEFIESNLVFLMPEQLSLLPKDYADLILAIDCLHEMDKEQVVKYFNEFDRVGKQLYFKCLQKTGRQFFQWEEYPVNQKWKEIINRPTFVPAQYFESIYSMR